MPSKISYRISYLMFLLSGVILLGILITYNEIGKSLNSTSIFGNESTLEIFRNTIADTFFQVLGVTSYLIPIFLIFCSFEIFTKKNISFLKYKVVTFFYSIITIPPVIFSLSSPYESGLIGTFLATELPFFTQFSYVFVILAIISLLFSFSISIKDLIFTKNVLIFSVKFIYHKIASLKNKNEVADFEYQEANKKISIMPDFESLKNEELKLSSKLNFFNKQKSEDDFDIEPSIPLRDNVQDDNFKNSIFYQNIKATKSVSDEYFEQEITDEFSSQESTNENVDFTKSFVNDFSDFISPKYINQTAPLKQEHSEPIDFSNEFINQSIDNISQNIRPAVAQPSEISSIEKIPPKPITNNVSIQLSRESEQVSHIKERKKAYHVPLSFLNIKPQKNTTSTFEIKENAIALEQIIQEFGINCKVVNIKTGPVVTLYEIAIPAGVKTSKLISLEADIALRMKAISVRIAVVAGKDVVGIEIPNSNRKTVFLKEILQSKAFKESDAKLPIALGYDINGNAIVVDLATMPHLLIAGTTGSGKSVGVNGMILSLLYKLPPEQCKLIMIDPKMLELSVYQDIPHLLTPVVINPKQAIAALKWVVKEMENRYYQMSLFAVRNIIGFNEKVENHEAVAKLQADLYEKQGLEIEFKKIPYIVVIIDEMADLMMVAGKEVEMAVQRLAQMARAAGIHLITATQRPSVDVITGTIKANFPTRISFQVSSKIDSRTILGEQGAEQLLGRGDMLYMSGVGRVQRVHGAFVEDNEVSDVVNYLKDLSSPDYIDNITSVSIISYDANNNGDDEKDGIYSEVIEMIHNEGKVSTSFIQRKFQIGYNRAARIVEQLEDDGIISKANSMGKREILIK